MEPKCPYCGKTVTVETLKVSKPRATFVLRNMEIGSCPHCSKILGVFSHVV